MQGLSPLWGGSTSILPDIVCNITGVTPQTRRTDLAETIFHVAKSNNTQPLGPNRRRRLRLSRAHVPVFASAKSSSYVAHVRRYFLAFFAPCRGTSNHPFSRRCVRMSVIVLGGLHSPGYLGLGGVRGCCNPHLAIKIDSCSCPPPTNQPKLRTHSPHRPDQMDTYGPTDRPRPTCGGASECCAGPNAVCTQ